MTGERGAGRRRRYVAVLVSGVALGLLALLGLGYRDDIRAWYRLRTEFESLGKNAAGYAEYRHRATAIVFVYLPGGSVEVGTTEDEWRALFLHASQQDFGRAYPHASAADVQANAVKNMADNPRLDCHQVRIRPFLIAKFEFTCREWERIYGEPPYQYESSREARNPVIRRTVLDARNFPAKSGLDLPTEEQWEYAARGFGARRAQPLREETSIAPPSETAYGHMRPPGTRPPNDFGVHDALDNVSEWCRPAVATGLGMTALVIRGGDAYELLHFCNAASRFVVTTETYIPGANGIRPVVNLYPR